MPMMQQLIHHQQLTADDYRRIRLADVQRQVEELKREQAEPREVLYKAAIAALSSLLTTAKLFHE